MDFSTMSTQIARMDAEFQQQVQQPVQEATAYVAPHFKFAVNTQKRVIFTDSSPGFLEHLFMQACKGRMDPQLGLHFADNVWKTLDKGAQIYLVQRFMNETTFGWGPDIPAAAFEDAAQDVWWVRPTDQKTSDDFMNAQADIQKPEVEVMKPTVDRDIVYVDTAPEKSKSSKVPRPMNAYMLYRADRHAAIMAQVQQQRPGDAKNNQRVSIITGQMWRMEHPGTRSYYAAMAAEVKRQFDALYPHYKYKPRNSANINRRARRSPVAL